MRTDALTAHSDDIGPPVGEFHGTAIRAMNPIDVELREIKDIQFRARLALGTEPVSAEVLPGEVVVDNVIRRATTAEALGEEFYAMAIPEGTRVKPEDALGERMVTWRPHGASFAVIHQEETENTK